MPGIKSIHGLAKGLRALTHITAVGSTTVRGLAQDLSLPEATAARILRTLENEGFVMRVRARRQYWATAKLSQLAAAVPPLPLIVEASGSFLEAIAADLDVAVMVSSGDAQRMEVLRANTRAAKLSITRFLPGYTFPTHESACGLVFLAYRPDVAGGGHADLALAELSSMPGRRPANLRAIRNAGYAMTDNRLDQRELCLAVPILVDRQAHACLEVRCMKAIANPARLEREYLPSIRKYAEQIGARVDAIKEA